MSPKLRVKSQKNDAGHLNWIKIFYGVSDRPKIRLDYSWDAEGLTSTIDFSGPRRYMPRLRDIPSFFQQSFIERIGLIKLVNLIEKIELIEKIDLVALITEISNIKNIESLDLIDKITLIDDITDIGTLNLVNTINLIKSISSITTIGTVTNPVKVKTEGLDNIMLDLLKSGAYIEDRRTLSNNGATPQWSSTVGNNYRGKFFTRGCMGFIESIEVYCRDKWTTGGTITVYISPNPSLGYVASATITVPIGGSPAWRSATFNRMWLSDKLFIFVVSSHVDIEHGFDDEDTDKRDSYATADAGATWNTENVRRWFRVVMGGQSVVILPIGGTVNTIEIPSKSDARLYTTKVLDSNAEITLRTIEGAGHTEYLLLSNLAVESSHFISLIVYTDSKEAFHMNFYSANGSGFTPTTPKISLTQYGIDGVCYMLLTLKFEFKRQLKIVAQRWADSPNQTVFLDGLVNLLD